MKLTLADNWRQLYKRGTVITAALFATIIAVGPAMVDAWNGMPPDLKVLLPVGMTRWVSLGSYILLIIVRYTALRPTQKSGDKEQP
ncbi:hypothetical protein ACJBUE_22455 (plasmid) [Ralstonia syzygii subsp. celebesensis]|uniref:Uncharacterized protein n=2 Tax=Ralstonia syzygii subsp. celebesensis TaxID=1310168 RepID=A0A1U9VQ59_9RALS|nr:hypothetical protein [Ralstonia syzygii]AQW32726.1 hypothetical protein B0B51_23395 [blood disease bacterium A2-HR MARDI]QQV57692.1 hypothetical protein JK151_19785 [Ralstonia syzygii subsp. celebesensis]CCA83792.1 conserved exported hypothetical protein [blood disease bacterium R229]